MPLAIAFASAKEGAQGMEVVIGVDPHKGRPTSSRRDRGARRERERESWSGRRPTFVVANGAKDKGLWSALGKKRFPETPLGSGGGTGGIRGAPWPREAPGRGRKGGGRRRRPAQALLRRAGALKKPATNAQPATNARKNECLDALPSHRPRCFAKRSASLAVQPEDGPEGHAEILRLCSPRRDGRGPVVSPSALVP